LGLEELINTLKKNGQKQIEDIWQQARAEADSMRKQTADAIARITEEHAGQLASACQKSVRTIVAESEIKVRKKKLFAYQELAELLHATALRKLPRLRELNYENVFARLVKELPDGQWEKITVNPSDVSLALRFFNNNIVQADAAVIGGLIAVNAGGKIIVDNTLEKRLERKWSQILPELIKNIENKYGKHKPAENTG
jgi:vacuolar-type H+-ATPase subunit E/Vma4